MNANLDRGDEVNKDFIEKKESLVVEKHADLVEHESNLHSFQIPDLDLQRQMTTIIESEKRPITYQNLTFYACFIIFSIVMSLLRGSSLTPSIISTQPCSPIYYTILIIYILIMLVFSFITSIFLIRKTQVCQKANYKFDEGDILWSPKTCLTIFLTGLATGVLVGLIGLGGGFIIGPILLRLKVRPEVMTVSSSVIICISAFVAVFQYLVFGVLDWKYAFWYWMTAVTGSLSGNLGLRKFVIKKGRSSLLVFFLWAISCVALVIIPTVGIIDAFNQTRNGNFQLGFTGLC